MLATKTTRRAFAIKALCAAAAFLAVSGCSDRGENGGFRIMSYNIRHGAAMDDRVDIAGCGRVIAAERPRFAGVQEVDMGTERTKGADTCAILEKATGMVATFARAIDYESGEYGVALLSRERPKTVRRTPLPGGEPRVLLLCEFRDCWVGTTHLAVDSAEARRESVEIIRKAVEACGDKPVFLTGDWNSRPESEVISDIKAYMTVLSPENEPTFHGGKVNPVERANSEKCIDYIAVSSAHASRYCLRGSKVVQNRYNSDHMPLFVDVAPRRGEAEDASFKVATFNVRCPGDDGANKWYLRMPRVGQVVRDNGFDLVGVQEATPKETEILDEELYGFARVGCGRDRDRSGEAMYIYYRESRFDCLGDGTFWLSETPDEPGSKYKGAGCPRTCTWALLRDRATGRTFRYFNTHLDHISPQARIDGMEVLLRLGVRPAKARGETVLLTGDMNETIEPADSPKDLPGLCGPVLCESAKTNAIALASTELLDSYARSERPHSGPKNTFSGYQAAPRCRIDYIFSTPDVRVLEHSTVDDRPAGEFASDHYPVAAKVYIEGK